MSTYQILARGVRNVATGEVLLPHAPGWDDYKLEVARGQATLLPYVPPQPVIDKSNEYVASGRAQLQRKIAKLTDAEFVAYQRTGRVK